MADTTGYPRNRQRGWIVRLLAVILLGMAVAPAWSQGRPLVPETVRLASPAQQALDAAWLTNEERAAFRAFHGVWDQRDLTTPVNAAHAALQMYTFTVPAFDDPQTPITLRAEASFRRGNLQTALDLLADLDTPRAIRLRAEALELLGNQPRTRRTVDHLLAQRDLRAAADASVLTDIVRTMMVQSRLEGQPARNYELMLQLLAKAHQELDRLYWPALLTEAELLLDKHNIREAVATLHQTLSLNPRCSEAWYLLGQIALQRFDFDSAATAEASLRRLNAGHPLADLLFAESRLIQDDPDQALEVLDGLLVRLPRHRGALAMRAAATALLYDEQRMHDAIADYEAISPGAAIPYAVVGRFLSLNRQYDLAATVLEEAIRRKPAWPEPQIEQGLMELQSGRDQVALSVLQRVTELDPFNKRAANSLFLLEELATYEQIETEHFIIRYRPGVDAVLARDMPQILEDIHTIVTDTMGFEPDRKTVIEVLPDHKRFGVRITGMPFIHTIAACTGPVIAMEVPREGKPSEHLGLFLWPRVLQHEYTHTVTLAQTRNRIPHWLTEAVAVRMELSPRAYHTARMLADSLENGTLFNLDEIKWAFVRPKRRGDRGKAYAQGAWMVEYMEQRFGTSALIRLHEQYFEGQREEEAIPAALGISREQFFADFLVWAADEVKAWGLDPQPSMTELTDRIRAQDEEMSLAMAASRQARLDVIVKRLADQIGQPSRTRNPGLIADDWPPLVRPPVEINDDLLATWRQEFPDHPDLLEMDLRRRIGARSGTVIADDVPLLERLLELRPVDPYPHKKLVQYWRTSDTPARAIAHLEQLDIREEKTPVYASELARLYRATGDPDSALDKANRALSFDPYHAPSRELAAAIAVEAQNLPQAAHHIEALTLLEPDRPQHARRLEAVRRLMNQ